MQKLSRKEQEKQARKHDIIESALGLFAEKGFHEVTMDEIAERVGISKGTLYLYFKNKDDMFFSVIQEKTNLLLEKLDEAVNYDRPFEECLKSFIQTYLQFFKDHRPFFKILHSEKSRLNMEGHYRLHEWGIQVFHHFYKQMLSLMKYGQAQKALRELNPVIMSKGLRGILNSFTFQDILCGNTDPTEKETEQILDLLLYGIAGSNNSEKNQ